MHARRAGVGVGLGDRELADLRTGETLARRRSGEGGDPIRAAERIFDLPALRGRRRIEPHRRARPGEDCRELPGEAGRGIERAQHRRRAVIQVDAAVLLRRAGNGAQVVEIEFGGLGQPGQHTIERIRPHRRRRMNFTTGAVDHAAGRAVLGKVAIVVERSVEDDAPRVAVDLDDDGGQALGACVDSQIQH